MAEQEKELLTSMQQTTAPMDVDDEFEAMSLEQAQSTLEMHRNELVLITGKFGTCCVLAENKTQDAETLKGLEERMTRLKSRKETLQIKVDQWVSIVRGLTTVESMASTDPKNSVGSSEKIVVQNGGKSVTLTLDPEYTRYIHESVIKDRMAKFTENERKQYPKVSSDTQLFVHEARETALAKMGAASNSVASRILTILCLDSRIKAKFAAKINADESSQNPWNWDQATTIFVNLALTPLEKAAAVEKFAKSGRGKAESYEEYGHRLERRATVYQVADLPQCADITETLRLSVPAHALSIMETREVLRQFILATGNAMPDTKSLPFFLNAVKHMHGPEDTPLYQTVHDARKRMREDGEQDEEGGDSPVKPKKGKFQNGKHHGQGKGATGTNTENANETPVQAPQGRPSFPNSTWHNQGNEGNRGGYNGGRGSYRGGYRGGHRGGYQGPQTDGKKH
jgi:hypothetical protein